MPPFINLAPVGQPCCDCEDPGGNCCGAFGQAVFRGFPQFVPRPIAGVWTFERPSAGAPATGGTWSGQSSFRQGDIIQVNDPTFAPAPAPATYIWFLYRALHDTSNPPFTAGPYPGTFNSADWVGFPVVPSPPSDDFRRAMNDYSGIVNPPNSNYPPGTVVKSGNGWLMRAQAAVFSDWVPVDFRNWRPLCQPALGIYQRLSAHLTAENISHSGDINFPAVEGTIGFEMTGGPGATMNCSGSQIVFVDTPQGQQHVFGFPLFYFIWPGSQQAWAIEHTVTATEERYVLICQHVTGGGGANVSLKRLTQVTTFSDFISCDDMVASVQPNGVTPVSPGHPCYHAPDGLFCGYTSAMQNLSCPVTRRVYGLCP